MLKKNHKSFYLLVIFILLLSNVVSVMHIRFVKKQEFIETSEQYVQQTTSMLAFWIEDQIRIVEQVASDDRIVSLCLDPEDEVKQVLAERFLKDLHGKYPYYENLPVSIMLDETITREVDGELVEIANGHFLVDTVNGETVGKGGPEYSYIREIMKGKPYYVSEIYRSIWRENPIFVISAPVQVEDELKGIAFVSPQMDYFTEIFVDPLTLGKTGYMFLVDSSGATIAHNNRDLILSDAGDSKETVDNIVSKIESGENFFEAKYNDTKKYYYGMKLNINSDNSENDMYIVFTQEKVEIYRSVHGFALASLIVILIASMLIYRLFSLWSQYQYQKLREQHLIDANNNLEIEVKKRTRELEDMTKRDSMTRLYNHAYIYEYLNQKLEGAVQSKNIVVAILDIDDFKAINDSHGHQIGDEVIKSVSDVLMSSLRGHDLIGRYGGEEFLVVLCDLDFNQCLNIFERIRKDIHAKTFDEIDHHISVSIGMSKWQGESATDLIKRADKMMYKAKFFGKNQIVHDNI
ncbi:diguanylate cyclase [Acidaminobacter sp. JC074]|uniref:sensor domain-containing diguanylate cyclase n=1 Tax=Acidaminobacter sp. JC074 TaxID=2530199 RepID=UPI001F0E64E2|nr:diguanylate cyclase [Acidaminobacter sp. JC074]MCH4887809.1 diguanylate cyclase [Acidaminobacter sp. JC074]